MSDKIQSGRCPARVKPTPEEFGKRWDETFGRPIPGFPGIRSRQEGVVTATSTSDEQTPKLIKAPSIWPIPTANGIIDYPKVQKALEEFFDEDGPE